MIRKRSILTLLCVWLTCLAHAQSPLADFTAATVSGCSPLVVNFSDASTGNPTSWYWDLGNGATSTLKNPSTTYFIPGSYTITLTVANATGLHTRVRQNFITIYGKPLVLFSGNDSVGCFPFPVRFSDVSVASPGTANTTWLWDFGNGTQSFTQNSQNTYVNTGNYTVTLKVTNDKGCWSSLTKPAYIRINGGIKADFSLQQAGVCQTPVSISFNNLSTGPGLLSYKWFFGDGDSSLQQSPSHTYITSGIYTVTLITKSSDGCSDTIRKPNLLNFTNITTSFTAPDSICVNSNANLVNTSSAQATNTLWDFGDNTTAGSTNATKAWTAPGTYTIRMLQNYGACTDSAIKTIKVLPTPLVNFTADKTIFCQAPAAVNFTNLSSGAVSYQWNFGDGNTSAQQNPSHIYTSYGSFNVTLVATNAFGCTDSFRRDAHIQIEKPVIVFDSLPKGGCVPLTVNFGASITSNDTVVSYLWNLGNGVTSSAINPSHTYTTQGTHNITLTITTASGCIQTYTMQEAVKTGTRPIVNFSAAPPVVCAVTPVSFTNLSTGGNPMQYLWVFGDGGTSTEQNPLHEYGDVGIFGVTLQVNNNGCRDSLKIDSIVKIKPPIAKYIYKQNCVEKLKIAFTDQSVGAQTWEWNFGDGNTSTQQHPVHTYQAFGTYTVRLKVTNDSCVHVQVQQIKVVSGAPGFVAVPTTVCKGLPVNFTADTTNMANLVSYQWDFGHGGPTATGMNASTTYPKNGVYTVILTVTDIIGCASTTVKQQYIRINGPTAGFTVSTTNGCKGLQVRFTDTSKADGVSNILRWQWNFGDGAQITNSSSQAVQHIYTESGSYPVSLKLTDAAGCVDSMVIPAAVNISLIKAAFIADTLSCPGANVHFTNSSQASAAFTSYWQFGDGNTSADPNPINAYANDGRYTIQLKITDVYGCVDSITKPQYVLVSRPKASYTVSDSASSCTPFQVFFTNTSSYYIGYSWELGGGNSSSANPIQYYNLPGVYQTKLVVTSPGGCTDTATKNIYVYDPSNASIHYLPLNGCKPLTVNIHSLAVPSYMNYIWDFGDGNILTGNDTATQHVYNFFGDFVPKLILTDASGCVIPVTGPDTIRIQGATAKFGLDKRLLCDSGLVRFVDSTTFNNPLTSYAWSFGDGTFSSLPSPTHYYSQPGHYPVSLNVLTQNSCVDTFRLSIPIKVVASPDIRIDGDSIICVDESMAHLGEFNRSDTSVVRWAWEFPNGNTANTKLPQRQTYHVAGRFIVRTIAANSDGCRDTAIKNIKINPLPSVTMPSVITIRTGTSIQIPATYSGGVISYNWTNAASLSCANCPAPVSTPKFNSKYRVSFIDTNGCRNVGDIQIIVFCDNDNVFVPNTFSPNGDGNNDIFYVRGKGLNRVKSLRVFNRWGQVVYEKIDFGVNDASAGWDGKFKGAKPVPDVYVYQMEVWCDNSTVVRFDGNVALIQ